MCQDRVTYECGSVTGPDGEPYTTIDLCAGFDGIFDGGANDGTLTLQIDEDDYTSGDLPPGDYEICFTATGPASDGSQTAETCITWTVIDPCAPPDSITYTRTSDAAFMYTILDT